MPRFARVRAYNAFAWGANAAASSSATAAKLAPGLVQRPALASESSAGLLVTWAAPSANLAEYGGDGGSVVEQYLVEYDASPYFDGPATEVVLQMPNPLEVLLGGRDIMTGKVSTALAPNVSYFVRVSAMNGVGYGPAAVTRPDAVVPMNELPLQPIQVGATNRRFETRGRRAAGRIPCGSRSVVQTLALCIDDCLVVGRGDLESLFALIFVS
jgi:hypothetical protein